MEPRAKLSGAEVKRLQDALLAAFPTRSESAQMVRIGLEENLDAIAAEKNLRAAIFELIGWAEAQGRLNDLVAAARRANPGNLALRDFLEGFGRKSGCATSQADSAPANATALGAETSSVGDAEQWARATTAGHVYAAAAVAASVGCTGWGLFLSDLNHEPQAYAHWRAAFAANLAILAVSCVALVRFGFQQHRTSRRETAAEERTPRQEAVDATKTMHANQMVQLVGSIWVSKTSIDLAVLVTALSIFALAAGTPMVRYFFFGSTP